MRRHRAGALRAPEGAGGGTEQVPHPHAFLAEERTNAPTWASGKGLEGPGRAWKGLEGPGRVGKLEVLLKKERRSMLMTATHSYNCACWSNQIQLSTITDHH